MDDLLKLWAEMKRVGEDDPSWAMLQAEAFQAALTQAFREAYSEGHCDGQNAADVGDEVECPKDIDVAWAKSQTSRALLLGLK